MSKAVITVSKETTFDGLEKSARDLQTNLKKEVQDCEAGSSIERNDSGIELSF